MNLANRIAKLEARLRPITARQAPVLLIEPDGAGRLLGPHVFVRSSDGARWEQPDGESLDVFRARVLVEAARQGHPLPGQAETRLCSLRPRLTYEQWAGIHGLPLSERGTSMSPAYEPRT